jgi:hypothetical protein
LNLADQPAPAMPRTKGQDNNDNFKQEMLDDLNFQDYAALEELRTESFCHVCLPPPTPPAEQDADFFPYLEYLGDSANLVISSRYLAREKVEKFWDEMPQGRWPDGADFKVVDLFWHAAENWFRFETEIVIAGQILMNPPFVAAELEQDNPWAHCATLKVIGTAGERRIRIIHVNVRHVFVNFLIPNSLLPKRLIL